jgi:hypothetical protein
MADYQLYFIDKQNRVSRGIVLECRDDAHAIEIVCGHVRNGAAELWQLDRLVKRFAPPSPQAFVSQVTP